MKPIHLALFAGALFLAACGGQTIATTQAAVTTDLATAQSGLAQAVKFYGIAKGIAQVAELADPALAPAVTRITGVVDPLIVTAQTLLADASADAATVASLAASISGQATTLETSTAQVIKVVAG